MKGAKALRHLDTEEIFMAIKSTTILAVRYNGKAAVAGDGQVTLDTSVVKHHAKKVRRIYNDRIIVGFAGATADALMLAVDAEQMLLISGNGDVIGPHEGILAIGSGGVAAHSAAAALLKYGHMENSSAREIVERAMKIAGDVCIYTNDAVTIEEI